MPLVWLVVLAALWWGLWEPRRVPGVVTKATLLLGHRGVRRSLPENSVEAFRAALDAGLDGLETDLHATRDGVIVLYHDFKLPSGEPVTRLTADDIRTRHPSLATLDDLFSLAREYPGTLLNLELKSEGWATRGLERAAVGAMTDSGLAARVLVSSFNPLSLVRVRLYAPQLRTALLYDPGGPRWLRGNRSARLVARLLHADALHPQHRLVGPALMRWAQKRALPVNAWTVNDPEEVKRLTGLNVNGLMADSPAALKDAYKEAVWSLQTNASVQGVQGERPKKG